MDVWELRVDARCRLQLIEDDALPTIDPAACTPIQTLFRRKVPVLRVLRHGMRTVVMALAPDTGPVARRTVEWINDHATTEIVAELLQGTRTLPPFEAMVDDADERWTAREVRTTTVWLDDKVRRLRDLPRLTTLTLVIVVGGGDGAYPAPMRTRPSPVVTLPGLETLVLLTAADAGTEAPESVASFREVAALTTLHVQGRGAALAECVSGLLTLGRRSLRDVSLHLPPQPAAWPWTRSLAECEALQRLRVDVHRLFEVEQCRTPRASAALHLGDVTVMTGPVGARCVREWIWVTLLAAGGNPCVHLDVGDGPTVSLPEHPITTNAGRDYHIRLGGEADGDRTRGLGHLVGGCRCLTLEALPDRRRTEADWRAVLAAVADAGSLLVWVPEADEVPVVTRCAAGYSGPWEVRVQGFSPK